MSIPCRITDLSTYPSWEEEDTFVEQRTIEDLTIAELMGEDHDVWLKKNQDFGYVLQIENHAGHTIIDKCIHRYAAESLADFCRRYLNFYDKLEVSE